MFLIVLFVLYNSKFPDYRLRIRKKGEGEDVDPLRDARVSRAGDHPEQRVQQGRRLVGARGAHVRDGGRLPAFLCRPAYPDLRKDRLGAGKISRSGRE